MSLLRATFADARSPVIGGLGQLVPTIGPPPPGPGPVVPPPLLSDLTFVELAWESRNAGLAAYSVLGEAVTTWLPELGPDNYVATGGAAVEPLFLPGAYTANGHPALYTGPQSGGSFSLTTTLTTSLTAPYTRVLVCSFPWANSGYDYGAVLLCAPGSGGDFGHLYDKGSVTYTQPGLHAWGNVSAGLTMPAARTTAVGLIANSASTQFYSDGTYYPVVPVAATGSPAGQLAIGAGPTNINPAGLWVQAEFVIRGIPTLAQMAQLQTYIDYYYRTPDLRGTFPTFGATDAFEFDADDLPEADLANITTTWVDRQNGHQLVPASNPVMHATAGTRGGKAIYFDGTAGRLFRNTVLSWAQPYTIMVVVKHAGDNFGIVYVTDSHVGNNGVLWQDNFAVSPAMYAGVIFKLGTGRASGANLSWGWTHFGGSFNGASSTVTMNAVQSNTGDAGTGALSGLVIGAQTTGNFPVKGWVSKVYGWKGVALTPAQYGEAMRYVGMI